MMKKIKKLNNKGMTAVEVLICFVLVVIISVSMYTTVSAYQNKQQIEGMKEKIMTYKNLLTKEINDDLIKDGLVSAKILNFNRNNVTGDSEASIEMSLRNGTKKCLKVKSNKAYDYFWDPDDPDTVSKLPPNEDKNDEFMISYGTCGSETDYPIPDLGESYNQNTNDAQNGECGAEGCIIKDLRINNVDMSIENSILNIYIGFYHPDLGTRYSIDIICPVNF